MGFVKRSIALEEYLDSERMEWEPLSDAEYRKVFEKVCKYVEVTKLHSSTRGERAFHKLEKYLPCTGYIFSSPGHKEFSLLTTGTTFGYKVKNITAIDREKLHPIEYVLVDDTLSFAYTNNHERMEALYEKCA